MISGNSRKEIVSPVLTGRNTDPLKSSLSLLWKMTFFLLFWIVDSQRPPRGISSVLHTLWSCGREGRFYSPMTKTTTLSDYSRCSSHTRDPKWFTLLTIEVILTIHRIEVFYLVCTHCSFVTYLNQHSVWPLLSFHFLKNWVLQNRCLTPYLTVFVTFLDQHKLTFFARFLGHRGCLLLWRHPGHRLETSNPRFLDEVPFIRDPCK